jgi:hypothetical protein
MAESSPGVLVHTSVPWGIEHASSSEEHVTAMILKSLNKIIPGLGEPKGVYLQHWKLSQISKGLPATGYTEKIRAIEVLPVSVDALLSTAATIATTTTATTSVERTSTSSHPDSCLSSDTSNVLSGKKPRLNQVGAGAGAAGGVADRGAGLVVLAGDYFTESNFEGCLASAKAAAETIGSFLQQRNTN